METGLSSLAVAVSDGYITVKVDVTQLMLNIFELDIALCIRNKDFPQGHSDAYTTVHLTFRMSNWKDWINPQPFPVFQPTLSLEYVAVNTAAFLCILGVVYLWPFAIGAIADLTMTGIGELLALLYELFKMAGTNFGNSPLSQWVGGSLQNCLWLKS